MKGSVPEGTRTAFHSIAGAGWTGMFTCVLQPGTQWRDGSPSEKRMQIGFTSESIGLYSIDGGDVCHRGWLRYGAETVTLQEAVERELIDFHALYEWTDWRDAESPNHSRDWR